MMAIRVYLIRTRTRDEASPQDIVLETRQVLSHRLESWDVRISSQVLRDKQPRFWNV